ncbi:4Fe-4S binding protein, partial [Candidatus Ozemobacteraceae bacterium]|nr:4Fe-4S binding protein [Candidatus Ozemobacteraceae bacterium]
MNHMKAIRRLSQAAALLGFIALFLAARFPFRPWAPVDLGLRFSPFGAVLDSLAGLKPALHYGPGIVILLLTPFFGRFFCGWLCPLGAMLDGWRRLFGPKAGESASSVPGLLRWPKYALLAFLSVATVAGGPFWGWFDPLALFNRLVTGVGYPLITYIMSSISSILTWIPGFIGFKRSIAKWLMPEAQFVPWQFWSL